MRQILSPEDLKKGELLTPGWYPVEVSDYSEKEANTDGSTNCIFEFKVLDGPSKGITANKLFNEKALGFGKSLWPLIGIPFDPQKGYELTTEAFKASIGRKLQVYVARGESNKGNPFNDVKDYKPLA